MDYLSLRQRAELWRSVMMIRFLGYAGLGASVMAVGLALGAGTARAEDPRPDGGLPAKNLPGEAAKPVDRTVAATNDAWMLYDNPSMRYEQPRFTGDARLFVRESNATSSNIPSAGNAPESYRWRVYRGRDLDVITRANSNLATSSDMTGLRQYLATSIKTTPASMRVTGAVRTSVEAPGLVYEPGTKGQARLFVRDAEGQEMMYSGNDFVSIARANPSLEQTAGFPAFRSRVQLVDDARPWTLRNDSKTIMNVTHTPTGVVVGTNEWRDGQWMTHTHQGATLAEIHSGQPTLRAMLVDGREGHEAPESAAPAFTSQPAGQLKSQPTWQVEQFGVTLTAPPSCLNSQLNLEGRGVLVTKVVPGSSADTFGLRNDDVILDYDGRAVTDGEWVRSQFASWRTDSRPKLTVLRQGSRVNLSR